MNHSKQRNVSCRNAEAYDQRFPDAEPGCTQDDEMVKAFGKFECDVCGRQTAWLHSRINVYLCSQDCLTQYDAQETS